MEKKPEGIDSDPANNGFKVLDLSMQGGVDEGRFNRRRSALEAVNDYFAKKEKSDAQHRQGEDVDREDSQGQWRNATPLARWRRIGARRRLAVPDRIAAGCEWVVRRTVDGEPSLNVGFQIGHQGRSLDLDDDAAGPRLRDRRVFEPERSAEAVESPCFHDHVSRNDLTCRIVISLARTT